MNHFFVTTIWTLAIWTYRTKLIAINWKVRGRSLVFVWWGGDTVAGQRNNGLFWREEKRIWKSRSWLFNGESRREVPLEVIGSRVAQLRLRAAGFVKVGELIEENLFFGFIFRKKWRSLLWHALRGGTPKFGRNWNDLQTSYAKEKAILNTLYDIDSSFKQTTYLNLSGLYLIV